ncbi:MAG: sulfotransferase [Candidatus Brocadia sp.]|nr:sulfotransferase [Candidatus Brocadia sp.]
MNVFIQGMRRSGTTILFDIFLEDGSFDCYYEPLAAANKKALGGGSGVHSIDYFDKIRECRRAFMLNYQKLENVDLLNYGAPRLPTLEFESDLPDYVRGYIRFMISQSEHTVIKFTRMYCKVHVLQEIDPEARFIHIVRDPRAVTASYLFGKNQINKDRYRNEKLFFKKKSHYSAWSSFPFSEFILNTQEYSHLKGCEDFVRILILWKYNFRKTHDAGKALFGENYLLLRHEDLLTRPELTLESMYNFLGRPMPTHVLEWAKGNINSRSNLYAPDNPRWLEAFKRLDMDEELHIAGYNL